MPLKKHTKSLANLLAGIVNVDPLLDREITGLSIDSRAIKPGDLFLAYPGEKVDGRDFIQQAIQAGAFAILAENLLSHEKNNAVAVLTTDQVRQKIGQIASRFYEHPSRYMQVTGVTGTNGKTSIAYLLACALNKLEGEHKAIYSGTLGMGFPHALQESTYTTLDAIQLQKSLAHFFKKHTTHAAIEVSSHALDQGRVSHILFQTAVFTNLTRDHLDYHKTMEAYGAAKAQLFKQFGLKSAVINWDDVFGFNLYQSLSPSIFGIGYSLNHPDADIYAQNIQMTLQGISADITTPWGEDKLHTPLIGRFNLYNILAVIGVLGLHYPLKKILQCIETLPAVPGRMQCIRSHSTEHPLMIVDYAHTPDALKNVLTTAREILEKTHGKLWCVFGCGGDRDVGKRPEMGKIAEKLADHVIITNDNPRSEDPQCIADAILAGIAFPRKANIILDREIAIKHAVQQAKSHDIIVIAGKGHENYQIIGTEKRFFSDEAVCEAC